MKNPVIIKSYHPSGIVLILDDSLPFEELLEEISRKFQASAGFFKGASLVLAFEGRTLSPEEIRRMTDTITDAIPVSIACVVDKEGMTEEALRDMLEKYVKNLNDNTGNFYRGTLRSGQVLESERSIIVIGNVNYGAKVVSEGNIIVLGSLKGIAEAGVGSRKGEAYIVALEMDPLQLRIGEHIARSPDNPGPKKEKKKKHSEDMEPMIAFVEEGTIYIEPVTKNVLSKSL